MSAGEDRLDAALAGLESWYDDALKSGMGFKSDEERQEYIKSLGDPEKHPMFARTTEDLEGNPLAEALRAIREEDKSPLELASMYKDEGNHFMKKPDKKSLHEAYDRYTHALTFIEKANDPEQSKLPGVPHHPTEKSFHGDGNAGKVKSADEIALENMRKPPPAQVELPTPSTSAEAATTALDRATLHSQILSNRAAASLMLQNYGSCCKDCEEAIRILPSNTKAHLRLCKALFALKKYEETERACQQALTVDRGNKDIFSILDKCQAEKSKAMEGKKRSLEVAYNSLKTTWLSTWTMAQDMGISLGYSIHSNPEPLQLRDCWPHIEPPGAPLWPVVLLYPQYNKLDVIPDADVHTMIAEHLANIFPELEEGIQPVDWDAAGEYQCSNLVVYLPLDTAPIVPNEQSWLENCLEHHTSLHSGNIELFNYAIHRMRQSGYTTSYNEDVKSVDVINKRRQERDIRHANTTKQQRNSQTLLCSHLDVHLGCTLQTILSARAQRNAIPRGILSLIIFPRGSKAHKQFLRALSDEKMKVEELLPNAAPA